MIIKEPEANASQYMFNPLLWVVTITHQKQSAFISTSIILLSYKYTRKTSLKRQYHENVNSLATSSQTKTVFERFVFAKIFDRKVQNYVV